MVFKLSFILAFHLRKTFLQFTDINHYEAAFNSLNYVPPLKLRLPVLMILHRQITNKRYLEVSYCTKFMTLTTSKKKVTILSLK